MPIARDLHILDRIRVLNKIIERSILFRTEATILRNLYHIGDPFRLNPKQILHLVPITSGALTTAISRLEARGLVSRYINEADGRGQWVELTDQGIELAKEQHLSLNAFNESVFASFDDIEQLRFKKLLEKLQESLERI